MDTENSSANDPPEAPPSYEPPAVTFVGTVAEVTASKQVGSADGTTFLGIDLGSV